MFKISFMFVWFVLAVYAKSAMEMKNYFVEQGLECTKNNTVSPDELKMLNGKKLPDSKESKCFLACVFKKVDFMDDKGMYNHENVIKNAQKDYADDNVKFENAKTLSETCKKVNEEKLNDDDQGCERALMLYKCLIENAPKLGFEV